MGHAIVRKRGLAREPDRLRASAFDLCVIGGGIAGAAIAWDAATRGLKVALVEKADFGGATSAGCFKIIHGGLRYLQHFDLTRLYESMREQRTVRRIAPHLVKPLPIAVPCYGYGKTGRGFLQLGCGLYDLLASSRNEGVMKSLSLPRHRVLTKGQMLDAAPGLRAEGLSGGVVFYDAQMAHSERLSFAVAKAAADAGAVAVNYAEFERADWQEGTARWSVSVRDLVSGAAHSVDATAVVNATGPWIERRLASFHGVDFVKGEPLLPNGGLLSKGFQIILPPIVKHHAVALESTQVDVTSVVKRGGRSYFLQPWRGVTIAGTTDHPHRGDAIPFSVSRAEVEEFLAELRSTYRSDQLTIDRVRGVFGGYLPTERLVNADESAMRILRKDVVAEHRSVSRRVGLFSVAALKYTTFRELAERVVDRVAEYLGPEVRCGASRTTEAPVAGGAIADLPDFIVRMQSEYRAVLDASRIMELVFHYGSELPSLMDLVLDEPGRVQPLVEGGQTLRVEIVNAIRRESALNLLDITLRRTALGAEGDPGAALTVAAQIAGDELGWDGARIEREVQLVREHFARP